jgi:hypothetical protein
MTDIERVRKLLNACVNEMAGFNNIEWGFLKSWTPATLKAEALILAELQAIRERTVEKCKAFLI